MRFLTPIHSPPHFLTLFSVYSLHPIPPPVTTNGERHPPPPPPPTHTHPTPYHPKIHNNEIARTGGTIYLVTPFTVNTEDNLTTRWRRRWQCFSALLFSVCNVFVCFSCFLFLKHDQFYQGWTAEHSAEHTTKSFTEFGLFWHFAEHCSWQSHSSGQMLQDTQAGVLHQRGASSAWI